MEIKIIEIKELVKIYSSPFMRKKTYGINGLDLDVLDGEIFGLLGPNGAGKTTTLKIITGLLKPTSGYVKLWGGIDMISAKKKMGFLPENPSFYRHLNGLELLRFYSRLYDKNLRLENLEKTLDLVGLKQERTKRISNYSKGMIQRIGFAQALIGNPDLLILDEPLGGLDPIGRKELKDLIQKVNAGGKTILFSSHILSDVETICDKVGIIIDGKMKKIGYLREILETDIRYTDIEMAGIKDKEWLKEYGKIREEGDIIFLRTLDEEKKDKVIKIITEKGGRIISVVPQRESLEEHFLKTVHE